MLSSHWSSSASQSVLTISVWTASPNICLVVVLLTPSIMFLISSKWCGSRKLFLMLSATWKPLSGVIFSLISLSAIVSCLIVSWLGVILGGETQSSSLIGVMGPQFGPWTRPEICFSIGLACKTSTFPNFGSVCSRLMISASLPSISCRIWKSLCKYSWGFISRGFAWRLFRSCWYWAWSRRCGRECASGRGNGVGWNALSGSKGGERGKFSDFVWDWVKPGPPGLTPAGAACLAQDEPQEGVGNGFEGENCLDSCKFWFLAPRPPPIRHFLLVVWLE